MNFVVESVPLISVNCDMLKLAITPTFTFEHALQPIVPFKWFYIGRELSEEVLTAGCTWLGLVDFNSTHGLPAGTTTLFMSKNLFKL